MFLGTCLAKPILIYAYLATTGILGAVYKVWKFADFYTTHSPGAGKPGNYPDLIENRPGRFPKIASFQKCTVLQYFIAYQSRIFKMAASYFRSCANLIISATTLPIWLKFGMLAQNKS